MVSCKCIVIEPAIKTPFPSVTSSLPCAFPTYSQATLWELFCFCSSNASFPQTHLLINPSHSFMSHSVLYTWLTRVCFPVLLLPGANVTTLGLRTCFFYFFFSFSDLLLMTLLQYDYSRHLHLHNIRGNKSNIVYIMKIKIEKRRKKS